MRNPQHTTAACVLVATMLLVALSGCVTHGDVGQVPVDQLAAIPLDADVSLTTSDGTRIRMRVTESGPGHVSGIDRHFREYRFERDEIEDIRVRPQNDLVVALAFFAVVFATGF